jgi:hypothetical protein
MAQSSGQPHGWVGVCCRSIVPATVVGEVLLPRPAAEGTFYSIAPFVPVCWTAIAASMMANRHPKLFNTLAKLYSGDCLKMQTMIELLCLCLCGTGLGLARLVLSLHLVLSAAAVDTHPALGKLIVVMRCIDWGL